MTDAEKISMAQTLLGNDAEATQALLIVYLEEAKRAILSRRFPFGYTDTTTDPATVPAMYDMLQVKLMQRYFLRRGAEGEVTHDENGINRTYGSANDEDLLGEIAPCASV